MHIRMPLVIVLLLALATAGAIDVQITNPIPAPVEKRGLTVEIRDIVRLPDTRWLHPADQDVSPAGWARVSYVRDLPDGRRFANDSRGLLYLLDGNSRPAEYANVAAAFPLSVYNRLESGFIGFEFHPEFPQNGLFYTVHGERAMDNPSTPHFIPPGFTQADVTYHNIITEWRAANPAANTFDGNRRELLRVGHVVKTSPTRSATLSSTRPRGPALQTTACSTRAAAISGSATAADRMRTIRARRSASTPSSGPSCGSIRAVLPYREG